MKRLSACSEATCGNCGRCDDTPRHEHEPKVDTCTKCGASLEFFWTSIAGVGQFCQDCAREMTHHVKRTA